MGNTSPKDMDSLLPLMNMVIYSIDKVKKLRLNREVSSMRVLPVNAISRQDGATLTLCPPAFRENRRPTETEPAWRRTS